MRHPRATFMVLAAVAMLGLAGLASTASAATAADWSATQLTDTPYDITYVKGSGGRVEWIQTDAADDWHLYTQKVGVDASPVEVTQPAGTSDPNWNQVSGDRLVWQVETPDINWEIYTQKMGVDAAPVLVSGGTGTYNIWPQVSGDRVVWYGSTELFTRKMGTDPAPVLLTSMEPVTDSVQVDGDRVVWTALVGSYKQVFTQKIGSDPVPVQLTTQWDHAAPQVDGDRIVWQGYTNGYQQIFTQKIGVDASPIQLTDYSYSDGLAPQVSGDRIVWTNNERVFTRKMGVDAGPIQLSSGRAGIAKVEGDRVIWLESDGSRYQLIAQDVGSGDQPVQLSTGGGGQPGISGEYVTWLSDVGGTDQVFVAHAPLPVFVVPTTIALTSGSASSVAYGGPFAVGGTLKTEGVGVVGQTVILQSAAPGGAYTDTSLTALTGTGGAFAFSAKPKSKTSYRVRFAGTPSYAASGPTSHVYAMPMVRLTRTTSWSSLTRDKAYYAKGYIEPYHSTRNSNKVKIRAYKKGSDKEWHYVKSFTASYIYSSKSKTAYKAKVVLTSKGSWKLVAYHATDSTNYKTYGSPDYVTVK